MKGILKKRKAVIMLLLILVMCCLSGCGAKEGDELYEIRVAYFPNITHSQALIMKNKGVYEEKLGEDISVKWINFHAGVEEVEAFLAGEVDIGFIGPIPAISGHIESNGNMVIIAGASDGGVVLVTRSDIILDSVKDLDGLTISVPSLGNTQHMNLITLLGENGLKTVDNGGTVKVKAVNNSDVMKLMDSRELDAAIVPEPWGSILENDIGARVLADWKDVWKNGDYSTSLIVTTKDFLAKHPEEVEKFLEAHLEATDYVNRNQEEAERIANTELKEITNQQFNRYVLDSSFSRLTFTTEISKDSINEFARDYLEEGYIDKLPGDELFDESVLDKVNKARGQ